MQPILVPILLVYLIYHFKGKFTGMAIGVMAGLLFDWLSDIVLTIYRDGFNMLSVLGYFGGFICYTVGFLNSMRKSTYKVSHLNRFIFSLPPIFYIIVYYFFIYNYMSSHEVKSVYIVPITLYTISVMVMTASALWRMGTTTDLSYWAISAGAIFYMISDSVTGYNFFVEPMKYRYFASMSTYAIALFLFTIGTILHQPQKLKDP
jgi:uncharacterized membrane protein YhhN